jgi:hypothetical protein
VKQQLRIAVPITVRPPSADIGNATAAVMVDVPLGDLDFDTRLAYVHAESRRLVTPTRVLASRFVMTTVLGIVPAILQRWFARTVYGPTFLQAIVSNMPGPTEAMSLLDVPLERVVPILPLAPGAPVALGALSWDGGLGIGIAADPDLLDAAALTTYVQETVNRLSTSLPQRAPRN